jgi:arginyl-tRNA synthetase
MKDKIEEILRKYIRADVEDKVGCAEFLNRELVKELSTLIQQEREEAIRGFVDYTMSGTTNDNEDLSINYNDLKQNIEEYLESEDK